MQSIPFVFRISKFGTARPKPFSASAIAAASTMVKGIRVHRFGGPEVLKWEEFEIGAPKYGEIKVKNKAIGVNYLDIYIRKGGGYRTPFTPGFEAAGVVTAVGPGVTSIRVGELVAFTVFGSYAEEQIVPAEEAVLVPPSIDPIIAAAVLLKGMTARVLVRLCFKVEPGHTVLVHAAAGGTGSLLCQWAKLLGATVIGTVSTREKAAQAREDGCDHVILYKGEDFVTRVNEITSGKGVDVVYDGVGRDTFQGSLDCLKPRGYMVSYGSSSGPSNSMYYSTISAKSLVIRRPALHHYNTSRDKLLENAGDVFAKVASGALRVHVKHTYPLSETARAHADLEGRRTSGSIVLIP